MHPGMDYYEYSPFGGEMPPEWRWIRSWSKHPKYVLPGQFWDKLRNRKQRLRGK